MPKWFLTFLRRGVNWHSWSIFVFGSGHKNALRRSCSFHFRSEPQKPRHRRKRKKGEDCSNNKIPRKSTLFAAARGNRGRHFFAKNRAGENINMQFLQRDWLLNKMWSEKRVIALCQLPTCAPRCHHLSKCCCPAVAPQPPKQRYFFWLAVSFIVIIPFSAEKTPI